MESPFGSCPAIDFNQFRLNVPLSLTTVVTVPPSGDCFPTENVPSAPDGEGIPGESKPTSDHKEAGNGPTTLAVPDEKPEIPLLNPFVNEEESDENLVSVWELLKNPAFRYWKRLINKELKDVNLRQEAIALLGMFRVKTPKQLSKEFNVHLGYVYKLIKSLTELCSASSKTIGEMILAHPEILAHLMKASPEGTAYFITKYLDSQKLRELGVKTRKTTVQEEELEEDMVLRFILTLALECRASVENIQVSLELVLGYSTSTTTIENILKKYEKIGREKAKELDMLVLPMVAAMALDEIFNHDIPIFTVVDLNSTYAILIKPRDDRKGKTWEAELNILKEIGLNPEVVFSDNCGSILQAVPESFEKAIVVIDIFHLLKGLNDVICQSIRWIEIPKTEAEEIWKRIIDGVKIHDATWKKLEDLEDMIPGIESLVDEIRIIRKWIIELVGFCGYTVDETKQLIFWCLGELKRLVKQREKDLAAQDTYKGKKGKKSETYHSFKLSDTSRKFFDNMPKSLDKYLGLLLDNLVTKAEETGVPVERLMSAYRLCRYVESSYAYNDAKRKACQCCRCDWQEMSDAETMVKGVMEKTPRASSLVENLNSRIRPALIKKKSLTDDYLNLLRLYLNTRSYKRSRKDERKGKSPFEIVTGEAVNFFSLLGIASAKPAVLRSRKEDIDQAV